MAEKIAGHLNALPETVTAVSCQTLRANLSLMNCKRTTFFLAVNRALGAVAWERRDKSLVRK